MSHSKDHFTNFADHTLLKHAILRSYLRRWAAIILGRSTRNREACFLDCFGGPGHDGAGREGSPLIAAQAVVMVSEMSAKGDLAPNAELRFAAVELDDAYYQEMCESVTRIVPVDGRRVLLKEGDYRDHLDELLAFANLAPTLSFVDPYGVAGLDARAFRRLLTGPKSELFVLVSGVGAVRLRGVVTADGTKKATPLQRLQDAPFLFEDLQQAEQARLEQERTEYIEALDATRVPAREALRQALGSEEALQRFLSAPDRDRARAFVSGVIDALRAAGAIFTVAIPMRDKNNSHKYTLLHASKSPRAVSVMKDEVSGSLNRDELDTEMRERIRMDLTVPVGPYVDWLAERLSGGEFFWASEDAGPPLKQLLLERTALFTFQQGEVKEELKKRGLFTKRDRKERVAFP